jgi:hypothetical protein
LAAIRHQIALLVEAEQVLSHADLASSEQIGVKILDGQINGLLVCGTGNKVEDFGIGFYTKYGDGGECSLIR